MGGMPTHSRQEPGPGLGLYDPARHGKQAPFLLSVMAPVSPGRQRHWEKAVEETGEVVLPGHGIGAVAFRGHMFAAGQRVGALTWATQKVPMGHGTGAEDPRGQ